uniref:Complement component C8 gamma chain n=1 Tax=Prolemur simus TaxID=1328070 RepID=A0A8C8YV72_PROSS
MQPHPWTSSRQAPDTGTRCRCVRRLLKVAEGGRGHLRQHLHLVLPPGTCRRGRGVAVGPGRRARCPAAPRGRQFAGTWLLVAVGSACRVLREQGHRAEATTLHVAPQGTAMAVSTLRKLDGICWQVRQLYGDTGVPGRFLLQARGARGAVHVVVAETDYQGFAILYLERAGRLSVKLYARSLPVSDSVLSGFERRVQEAHLTEDQVLFFPKYGFCEAADQFHVLDGEWVRGPAASTWEGEGPGG